MNAIVDHATLQQPGSPLYFPVGVDKVLLNDGVTEAPGWQGIYNRDTEELMHIHKTTYQLVTNEEIFENFDQAIRVAGLHDGNVEIKDELSHGGCRAFRQYIFHDHELVVDGNDRLAMRLIVRNSYDGSSAFVARMGAYRFVCSNGMNLGKTLLEVAQRHTKGFQIDKAADKLVTAVSDWSAFQERIDLWSHLYLTYEQCTLIFKRFAKTERMVDYFARRLMEAHPGGRPTLWNVHNILTAWASHGDVKGSNAAATRSQRDEDIGRFIECKEWKMLEAA
ncbi:MAG: DUF932 domain-containing protein [Kordiimonadaceae bacterium]|nr:DUF932 domain-containing protein [Kordiimonadaceae bacterium]